jgi:diguanylate cyclase (GGDEF)-like protein
MRLSTRSQLIILGILILAFIIGATNLVISMQRRAAIDAYETATTNLANGMSRQTMYVLTQADGVLKTVNSLVGPSPGLDPAAVDARMRSQAVFGLLSQQIARISGVDALLLVGADGKVANSSQGWPAKPVDVSGQDYFSHFEAQDDAALFAGDPVRDPASGAWTVPMARRIDAANGAFAGVAVAELSLQDLAAFYQLAMPPNRALSLARRDGVVLLHYPPRVGDIGRRIPAASPWYRIVAQGGGVYDAPAYFSSAPVIAVVRPLPDLPFVIEASITRRDALLQWAHERYWIVLGGIFSAVCGISLLLLYGWQFRRIEISERILAAKNAELDITHQQLEVTLANLVQGVCFFDANNKLLVFNRRFCQLTGLPSERVRIGMSAAEIAEQCIAAGTFWNQSLEDFLAALDARIRAGLPVDEVSELMDGRTVSKHFEPLAGHGWIMTLEDISERRAAEQKIAYLAHHDLLTGLANRSLFQDQLGLALIEAALNKGFAMLYLDLDRFKALNDSFGHPVGDSLLRMVADRLRATVRDGDTVVRMGGDEFVILQRNVSDRSETIVLADRLIEAIATPFVVEGHRLSIGVSIGITLAQSGQLNPERLLHDADLALYRAKQEGRGTWRIFDTKIAAEANARSATDIELLDDVPQERP